VITDIAGVAVGHWSDLRARTGCTAVILPPGTVASGEIRGGAPGTREWALLDPFRRVEHVDVVVLTGGSAFGLAACDGAVQWCEERGRGVATAAGAVPIVVGLVLYDLAVGDASVRPGAAEGRAACAAASSGPVGSGRIGAGTGATMAKLWGPERSRPGGLGNSVVRDGGVVVAALVAVNAVGDLRSAADGPDGGRGVPALPPTAPPLLGATTIGVVVTNARVDKLGCHLMAQSGHDGMARALDPVHTAYDGDGLVVAATGAVDAELDRLRPLAAAAVEAAIRDAVRAGAEPVADERA